MTVPRRPPVPEPAPGAVADGAGPEVVLTGVSSDSHTWNLVYLQLLMQEQGANVTNLGACVPEEEVLQVCRDQRPDLLVVSSVNGHGSVDGSCLIHLLRGELDASQLPAVIGGKLGVAGVSDAAATDRALRGAGFNAVFQDSNLGEFVDYVRLSAPAQAQALEAGG